MVATPWRSFARADPAREYVALASFLPLARSGKVFRFLRYSRAVNGQLANARGLVGYSMRAKILSRKFWTLSVWEDEGALAAFVGTAPHARIMGELGPHMGATGFVRWRVRGDAVPLDWADGLRRLAAGP